MDKEESTDSQRDERVQEQERVGIAQRGEGLVAPCIIFEREDAVRG